MRAASEVSFTFLQHHATSQNGLTWGHYVYDYGSSIISELVKIKIKKNCTFTPYIWCVASEFYLSSVGLLLTVLESMSFFPVFFLLL